MILMQAEHRCWSWESVYLCTVCQCIYDLECIWHVHMLSTDTWTSRSVCHCVISAWMHLCSSVVSDTGSRHPMCYSTLRMHVYLVLIIIIGDIRKSHSMLYMRLFIHCLKMETPFEVYLFFKIPPWRKDNLMDVILRTPGHHTWRKSWIRTYRSLMITQ